MRKGEAVYRVLLALYAFLWVGGAISYITMATPPPQAAWTAPLFLFLLAGVILLRASPATRISLLAAAAVGFLAEVVGLLTGLPFGEYEYTQALNPRVAGVPLAIGCAWLILFAYVKEIIGSRDLPAWARALAGAAWMTSIDLVIDPLAAGPLDFWRWQEDGFYYGVPTINFAGWFGVSILLFLAFPRRWERNRAVAGLGLSVVLFFTVIAFGVGMLGPALIGLALVGVDLLVRHHREGHRLDQRQDFMN